MRAADLKDVVKCSKFYWGIKLQQSQISAMIKKETHKYNIISAINVLLTQYRNLNWRKDRKEKTKRKGEVLALSYFLLHPFPSSPSFLFAPLKTCWLEKRQQENRDIKSSESRKENTDRGTSIWNTSVGLNLDLFNNHEKSLKSTVSQWSCGVEMKVWTLMVLLFTRLELYHAIADKQLSLPRHKVNKCLFFWSGAGDQHR